MEVSTATETPDTVAAETPASDRLQRDLLEAVSACRELSPAFTEVARLVVQAIDATGVLLFRRDNVGQLALAERFVPNETIDILDGDVKDTLIATANAACKDGRIQQGRFVTTDEQTLLSTPVFTRGSQPHALAVVVPPSHATTPKTVVQLAATHLTMWHVFAEASNQDTQRKSQAALLELLARLQQSGSTEDTALTLVGELRAYLNCETVALGLCRPRGRSCFLQAVSGMAQFDKRSELARTIEAVFDETILRDTLTVWPATNDSDRHATRAHQDLAAATHSTRVISSPLKTPQGDLTGAWVFLENESTEEGPDIPSFVGICEGQVAAHLQLVRQCEGGRITRGLRAMGRVLFGWKAALVVLLGAMVCGMLAVPMPYRIGCDAQIQPVTRRFVAAPFDATLEKSLVCPGDVVSAGDVLARIDGREIRWELDGLVAEYNRIAKKRDSALVGHQVAEAQLAKLEMERIELRAQLLEHRIGNLDIKSPIEGIVVSGDLEKAEGVPLDKGQTLFEIAPLAEMFVEVAVPEEDIPYVAAEQEATLRLDAYPGEQWNANIAKIHPRAEIRDDRNVFVAEFSLENQSGVLRPGMKGRAKITGPRRVLAWNLFHRPYEKLLQALGR